MVLFSYFKNVFYTILQHFTENFNLIPWQAIIQKKSIVHSTLLVHSPKERL